MSEEVVVPEVKEVKENQLVVAVRESGLDQTKAQVLLDKFTDYFDIASKWENTAKGLVITSVEQKTEMKMAREGRLFLKGKRTDIERTRKQLKESSLREGQTIDAIAKILTNLIIPIEEDLEQKEKFAEIQEAKRRAELKAAREIELEPFTEFVPLGLDFGAMDDANYQVVLNGAKLQRQAKLETEAKAAAEAAEREKIGQLHCTRLLIVRPLWQFLSEPESQSNFGELSESDFNAFIDRLKTAKKEYDDKQVAIQAENERLRKEQEEKNRIIAEERAKAEAERKAAEEKARKEREAAEAKLRIERESARKAAEKAAAEKAKLEAELREKAEAEARAKREEAARLEAERKEKEAAERKAANAPDKEKLQVVIDKITALKNDLPEMAGNDAKTIMNDVCVLFAKIVTFIQDKSEKL